MLVAKLRAARKAVDAEDTARANKQLRAYIRQVEAQSGKAITEEQANELFEGANRISAVLDYAPYRRRARLRSWAQHTERAETTNEVSVLSFASIHPPSASFNSRKLTQERFGCSHYYCCYSTTVTASSPI